MFGFSHKEITEAVFGLGMPLKDLTSYNDYSML